jgi:hypothetical protein
MTVMVAAKSSELFSPKFQCDDEIRQWSIGKKEYWEKRNIGTAGIRKTEILKPE